MYNLREGLSTRQPRLEVTGPGPGVERQRQRLEVDVEAVAEVTEHGLTQTVGLDRLGDPEHAGRHRDGEHDRHQDPQER